MDDELDATKRTVVAGTFVELESGEDEQAFELVALFEGNPWGRCPTVGLAACHYSTTCWNAVWRTSITNIGGSHSVARTCDRTHCWSWS